jgi:hypothetical protein
VGKKKRKLGQSDFNTFFFNDITSFHILEQVDDISNALLLELISCSSWLVLLELSSCLVVNVWKYNNSYFLKEILLKDILKFIFIYKNDLKILKK